MGDDPMTPLERAARALHRRRVEGQHPKPDNYPWESLSRREQAIFRADAYAILAAIREPSEAMVEAGWASECVIPSQSPEGAWQAMIDAMLEEGNT